MKAILTTPELIEQADAERARRETIPREIAERRHEGPVTGAPKLDDLSISDKLGKLVRFDPLPAQLAIRRMIETQRREIEEGKRPWGRVRIVVVKARQMGISTEVEGHVFELVASRPFTNALTIAHVAESAAHLNGIAKRFWSTLPDHLRPEKQAQNARGLTFSPPLESKIGIEVVGEGAGRSRTLHALHASEVALWPGDVKETLAALRGGLVSEPWCLEILESTGYGLGGGFYDEYQAAKKDGRALFFPWFLDPRYRTRPAMTLEDVRKLGGEREAIEHVEATILRVSSESARHTEGEPDGAGLLPDVRASAPLDGEQIAWLASKLLGEYAGDVRRFKREFPATEKEAFTGDARQVFSEQIIARVSAAVDSLGHLAGRMDEAISGNHSRLVRVIAEPGGPDSAYVIGADPAEGLEHGDDSALVVIDRVRRRVCACARTGLDPDEFATLLCELGRYYNRAYINCELNSVGYAVVMLMRKLGYPNVWRERLNEAVDAHVTSNFGYRTTAGSKARAVGSVIENVRTGLAIPFPEIREQMVTFVRDERRKMGAVPGCKDDLVSALWLASVAADELGVTDPVSAKLLELRRPPVTSDPLRKGIAVGTLSEVLEAGGHEGFSFDGNGGADTMIGAEIRRT